MVSRIEREALVKQGRDQKVSQVRRNRDRERQLDDERNKRGIKEGNRSPRVDQIDQTRHPDQAQKTNDVYDPIIIIGNKISIENKISSPNIVGLIQQTYIFN